MARNYRNHCKDNCVLNCGMDAGFELARWGISLLQQQQQQITVCLSLTWLTPPDRASLYQLPGMGSSHGKNHGCSTSVNTEVQKQGHVYCCRLLKASLAYSSRTRVPMYLWYRRVKNLAPQNTGSILRVRKHLASKLAMCVWSWLC